MEEMEEMEGGKTRTRETEREIIDVGKKEERRRKDTKEGY